MTSKVLYGTDTFLFFGGKHTNENKKHGENSNGIDTLTSVYRSAYDDEIWAAKY